MKNNIYIPTSEAKAALIKRNSLFVKQTIALIGV